MSSRTVVVDDSDTDAINYGDAVQSGSSQARGWSPYTGASLDENFEGPIHNSTLHAATFTGTSLEFPFSEYAVVGAGSTTNISTGSFQAPNFTVPKNNINLFTSNDMPYGAYVLTVNVTLTSIDSPYYLDYIAVEVPNSAPTSFSTSTSAAPVSGSSAEAASTAPSMPVSSLSTHASLPIGAIVGVAIAAAVFIAIVVAITAYRCARRRRGPPEYEYEFVGEQDEGMVSRRCVLRSSSIDTSLSRASSAGNAFRDARARVCYARSRAPRCPLGSSTTVRNAAAVPSSNKRTPTTSA
ncbi:hypothetical protein TRAPUB_12288 [Trametes pubescens]|uniref:Mid2 domain-containing protein n=1 Tax=Trametes pubescens TaxID=154538 RepID=A0A1M2VU84_TRAPU|nr:hypothetical protein TRAPUB_12288 [Trametes pubescens]